MPGSVRDIGGVERYFGAAGAGAAGSAGRLDTWKEIGSFLGRDERTAKRWEALRGLPVHRVPGAARSKVYAYTDELTSWLNGAASDDAGMLDPSSATGSPTTAADDPFSPKAGRGRRLGARSRNRWLATGAVLAGIAALVGVLFAGEAHRAAARSAPGAEAVQLYRAGLHDWNTRTPEGLHMAVDEFTQAIVRDPDYADAYVGLANCYNLLREYTNMAPSEAYPRAKAAAMRAIALDDSLAGGHLALAFEQFYWEWNTAVATREFHRALSLDPQSAMAHHWYAVFELHLGNAAAALAEIDQAQQLDPDSTAILADKGRILYAAGRAQDAVALLKGLERTNPDHLSAHCYLTDVYLARGDMVDYLSELQKSAQLLQDNARISVATAARQGWSVGGERGMFRAMLKTQLALRAQDLGSNYEVAESYALLGDPAQALRYLAASRAAREPEFIGIGVDDALSTLHGQPAFTALSRGFTA